MCESFSNIIIRKIISQLFHKIISQPDLFREKQIQKQHVRMRLIYHGMSLNCTFPHYLASSKDQMT